MSVRQEQNLGEKWKLCDGSKIDPALYPEYAQVQNAAKGYGGNFNQIESSVNIATALGAELLPVMYKGNYLFLVNTTNSNGITTAATLYWHNSLEAASSELAKEAAGLKEKMEQFNLV